MLSTKVGRLLISCASGAQDSGIYVDVPDVRVAFDYSYDGVMRSYEASLKRLGRAVDILYVHDIDASAHGDSTGADARIAELVDGGGWRALIELRAAGDVRAIGAGVNEVRACLRLLEVATRICSCSRGAYFAQPAGAGRPVAALSDGQGGDRDRRTIQQRYSGDRCGCRRMVRLRRQARR